MVEGKERKKRNWTGSEFNADCPDVPIRKRVVVVVHSKICL